VSERAVVDMLAIGTVGLLVNLGEHCISEYMRCVELLSKQVLDADLQTLAFVNVKEKLHTIECPLIISLEPFEIYQSSSLSSVPRQSRVAAMHSTDLDFF
jgi:hypothetical protein